MVLNLNPTQASRPAPLSRRYFIGGIATLPAWWSRALAQDALSPSRQFWRPTPPVTSADQVLNVMDFESLARDALPPAHFGNIATGVDDDRTVARNHEAFSEYAIRAHRFTDVGHLDMSVSVFGNSWRSPVYLSAVSGLRAFHPDGELAVARAAKAHAVQLMLSTGSSTAVEAVIEARDSPIWQQLYPTDDWAVTAGLVRRAESAGCTAIVLTVDVRSRRNTETLKRATQNDSRQCTDCHPGNSHDLWRRAPLFAGLDVSRVTSTFAPDQSVAFLARLRALVKGA